MLVYNTATVSDVTPGFYFWSGAAWVKLSTGGGAAGWQLTGNAGTTDGSNFIGTTDDVPLNFRVFNTKAGRIGNAGDNSVFWGLNAGLNDDKSDNQNTSIGTGTLQTNTTGFYLSASGYQALFSNTTGNSNTANGYQALFSNTTANFNTALGFRALYSNLTGNSNTANGYQALYSNTSGFANVALGHSALYSNTTGESNTALGNRALYTNSSGRYNVANGTQSLNFNTIGNNNTANGYQALYNNTTGGNNIAIGFRSLYTNTTSDSNTAIGYQAVYANTTGFYNIGVGFNALYANTTGRWNTAIGGVAGDFNTTGTDVLCLGYLSDVSVNNLADATAIGESAVVNASNKVRIGNTGITVIEGQVAWSNPSDARFKYNVQNNVPGLDFISRLKPVTYQFDTQKFDEHLIQNFPDSAQIQHISKAEYSQSMGIIHSGFIAQEVEKACLEIGYRFDGLHVPDTRNKTDNYSLAYSQFIVPLVKSIQEEDAKVEQLKTENKQLKTSVEQVKAENENLKASLTELLKRMEVLEKKMK
jgi:hypothetical protein